MECKRPAFGLVWIELAVSRICCWTGYIFFLANLQCCLALKCKKSLICLLVVSSAVPTSLVGVCLCFVSIVCSLWRSDISLHTTSQGLLGSSGLGPKALCTLSSSMSTSGSFSTVRKISRNVSLRPSASAPSKIPRSHRLFSGQVEL